MNELDSENKTALKQIEKLAKLIYLSSDAIRNQEEIRNRMRTDFNEMLKAYPKAREAYYSA